MKQIHISQINNGWLVSTPPEQSLLDVSQGPAQPDVHYCATLQEVADYILTLS